MLRYEVTLTATNGTLNLQTTQGLTFTPPADGTADATMTFTGTIADINAALEGMTFVATPGFIGSASVQITTDDLGNSGAGGAQSGYRQRRHHGSDAKRRPVADDRH